MRSGALQGASLLDAHQQLLIEAKVRPQDVAFLHPGQKAMVKFSAYDYTIYGGLSAKLELIGADTITDFQVGSDLIEAVDGKPVEDWIAFLTVVRGSNGKALQLQGLRGGAQGGQRFDLTVTPDVERKGSVTVSKIGAYAGQGPDMIEVTAGPVEAVGKGAVKVWDTSVLTLKMIGKMIVGEVSWKNVTGPITIADYAGQTARIGVASYLSFIAFISISLGVMNLLPIPVLDGGLLLYYSLEVLTGRPVPERFGEIAQRLGVGLLVTLMALAVFNDVARLL
eukprot:gene31206-38559_t